MANKFVLGLTGMFLAGLALTGCQNTSSTKQPFRPGGAGGAQASNTLGNRQGTATGNYANQSPQGGMNGAANGNQAALNTPGGASTQGNFNSNRPMNLAPTNTASNNFGANPGGGMVPAGGPAVDPFAQSTPLPPGGFPSGPGGVGSNNPAPPSRPVITNNPYPSIDPPGSPSPVLGGAPIMPMPPVPGQGRQ